MTTHSFLSLLSRSTNLCQVDLQNAYKINKEYTRTYTRDKLIYLQVY